MSIPRHRPTDWKPVASKPRGHCPVCGMDRALRKDGTLATHTRHVYLREGSYNLPCPGRGQQPKEDS